MAVLFNLHAVQQPGRRVTTVHRPATVDAALQLLHEDPARRPLAGGTDILLDLHRGGQGPDVELIDLTAIEGFDAVVESGDQWLLAGGVRHGQIVSDNRFVQTVTPLAQACLEIGSPQLRNRATLAGNLATASPANDSISALMALGASVDLGRWDGGQVLSRQVPVVDFFAGFRKTVLQSDELITAIRLPKLAENQRGLWVKLGNRRAQAISVIHAGLVLELEGGRVTDARVALGSVAATVALAAEAMDALIGSDLNDAHIIEVASIAAAAFEPIDDVRASAEYRSASISTIVRRALTSLRDGTHRNAWPAVAPQLDSLRTGSGPAGRTISDNDDVSVSINGQTVTSSGSASATLLDWIRDQETESGSLTGTKEGCAEGECGACTVQLNGAAVMSCIVSAAQADGGTVVTVEGLASSDRLHPIQQSFIDEFAVQCGFCIPGFLVAGAALLDEIPDPSDDQIKLGLSGNLCRCTGYYPMISALHSTQGVTKGTGSSVTDEGDR